jgi:hypothetical protein
MEHRVERVGRVPAWLAHHTITRPTGRIEARAVLPATQIVTSSRSLQSLLSIDGSSRRHR